MPTAAIAITGLCKTFGPTVRALDAVSLEIKAGEMVGLIGASGSGKSTLLRHMAGLVAGDRGSGTIVIAGQTVQSDGRVSRNIRSTRRHIGFVFQQFNLVGRLTVLTNVLAGRLGSVPFWRGLTGWFADEERRDAVRALSRVGIAERAHQRASTLSGGQQQRAAIARALVQKAQVILADEPIASLDPESARRVMELLFEINKQDGITVVVSLHQVGFALRYCDRIVALNRGVVVYDAPATELSTQRLREIYGADSDLDFGEAEPSLVRPAARRRTAAFRPGFAEAAAG